ncbi:MAG: sco1, partial [Verrucomicrobiales bacterium]|nr:sco1 [Verrucomicrobiales bacterium]
MAKPFYAWLLSVFICTGMGLKADDVNGKQTQTFPVKGVLQSINFTNLTATIRHEEIPGYMEAMTMPFHILSTNEWMTLAKGDSVEFKLTVGDQKSWISEVRKIGSSTNVAGPVAIQSKKEKKVAPREFTFTNELGQAVTLGQFRG